MIYPNLGLKLFDKNAKSRMRVCDAARIQSNSMVQCIEVYRHMNNKCQPENYNGLIKHCKLTNHWVDVMNNCCKAGCKLINSPDHHHVYELLDYVKFHTLWKDQAGKDVNKYFPRSTYEDVVWTSMSIVILARTQFQGHAIVQRRHGTDDCEKMFCIARNKCANATAFGTNQNIATANCEIAFSLWGSKKANCTTESEFHASELLACRKNKRIKLVKNFND